MAPGVGLEPTTSRVACEVTVLFTTGRRCRGGWTSIPGRSRVARPAVSEIVLPREARNDEALRGGDREGLLHAKRVRETAP